MPIARIIGMVLLAGSALATVRNIPAATVETGARQRAEESAAEHSGQNRTAAVSARAGQSQGRGEYLILAALAAAGFFSIFQAVKYFQSRPRRAPGSPDSGNGARSGVSGGKKPPETARKSADAPFERALALKELRSAHAAEIERLIKRV